VVEAARASGVAPADWIASRLPVRSQATAPDESLRAARARLWEHVVSLGRSTGTGNERIDDDLARAYLDPHEAEGEPPDGRGR
jgi:hypothetical protein